MLTLSYGELPTKKQFKKAYKADLGDDDYVMQLKGEDAESADGTIFESAIERDEQFEVDGLWKGIKQLTKKWENGDENAGSLASSILYTLDIEWI